MVTRSSAPRRASVRATSGNSMSKQTITPRAVPADDDRLERGSATNVRRSPPKRCGLAVTPASVRPRSRPRCSNSAGDPFGEADDHPRRASRAAAATAPSSAPSGCSAWRATLARSLPFSASSGDMTSAAGWRATAARTSSTFSLTDGNGSVCTSATRTDSAATTTPRDRRTAPAASSADARDRPRRSRTCPRAGSAPSRARSRASRS